MSKDLLYLMCFQLAAAGACLFPAARRVKGVALVLASLSFLFSAHMFLEIPRDGMTHYRVDWPWIDALGIRFSLGMDGISFLLVQLTNLLVALIVGTAYCRDVKRPKAFFSLIFLMQFALNGVFTARDGFLFYVFWELALIPIWFICLNWGGPDRSRITLKFFLYTLTGSLLMLFAFLVVYLQTPAPHSFGIDALYSADLDAGSQQVVFWLFLAAFAVKIPLFPLHTWQPDTYTDAPAQGTMLLSGIMLKMGLYGLLRWLMPVVPGALQAWGWIPMACAVTGIVYASCIALVQTDFKRMLAYSSMAHVGLIAAGILSGTMEGMQGGMIQMIAHGVNAVGLFFVADLLMARTGTRTMGELGGLATGNPAFAALFMVILMGSVALPLTNGFVGEFLLLNGIYRYGPWTAAFAGTTVILGAVYMLRAYKAIMLGKASGRSTGFAPLKAGEKAVLAAVAFLVLLTGLYPVFLTDLSEPAIKNLYMLIR